MHHRAVNQDVNFYSRRKRKTAISPPIFSLFQTFFSELEIIPQPLLWPKNPNLNKIADLKVYGNLIDLLTTGAGNKPSFNTR